MKLLCVILFLCSLTRSFGVKYDGLRVKHGWSDALKDREYFYDIPRTMKQAEALDWKRTERPPGPMPELKMYCKHSKAVCPLYDPDGFVAGLQLALSVDEFESLAIRPEKKFVKWQYKPDNEDSPKDYWTLTQFYVSPESLKAGAGPQAMSGETLQDGGVWVPQGGKLLKIPVSEAELNKTSFKKQNCVPNMGTHYYYNMTPSMKCEDLFPWFALTSRGELIGTGFQWIGRLPKPPADQTNYFERIGAAKREAKITIPNAPECLYEWAGSYGVVSLHIYYVNEPWLIKCRDGDSAEQPPPLDRLMMNGVRYASKVADEFKKIFTG